MKPQGKVMQQREQLKRLPWRWAKAAPTGLLPSGSREDHRELRKNVVMCVFYELLCAHAALR